MENKTNNNSGGNPNMPPRQPMQPRRRGPLSIFYGFWVLVLVGLFVMPMFTGEGTPRKIDWKSLEGMLVSGDVSKIEVVNDKTAHIWLKKEAVEEPPRRPCCCPTLLFRSLLNKVLCLWLFPSEQAD